MRKILIYCLILFFPFILKAQCLQANLELPEVNGMVNVIKPSATGDTLFVGGAFTDVSPKVTGSLALLGRSDYVFQNKMPIIGNTVEAIAPDGSGGWYFAGKFVKVYPGTDRFYVARVRADGSLHPFQLKVDGEIKTIQFAGDRLYLGGNFTMVNQQSRNYIAAVDTNGVLLNWAPNLNNPVFKILWANNKVYVGGDFTTAGGLGRTRLAVFDTFNSVPNAISPVINGNVADIEADDSLIYISGTFTSVNSTGRNLLAAIRISNGSLHTFNANINGYTVNDILLLNNKLVISGNFTSVGLQNRTAIAAVNRISGSVLATSLNVTVNPSATGIGNLLYRVDSLLLFGGNFAFVNGQSRRNFAVFDTGSFSLNAKQFSFNHSPLAVGVNGSTVLIGGEFTAINTISKRSFFAYRISTKQILNDGIRFTGNTVQIDDINFYNNLLVFGGVFDTINNQYRKNLGMVDFSGNVSSWNLPADNEVKKIEIYNQIIFVAGDFANVGGLARTKFAALDAGSSSVLNFIPDPNAAVNDLTISGNRLFVGGAFSQINGVGRLRLASYAINGSTISLEPWSVAINLSHTIKKLGVYNSRLYVMTDSLSGINYYGNLLICDTFQSLNKPYKILKSFNDFYLNLRSMTAYDSLIMVTYYYTNNIFSNYLEAIEPDGNEITPLLIGGYSDLYSKKIGERIYLYGSVTHQMNIYGNYISYLDLSIRPFISISKTQFCTSDTLYLQTNALYGNHWQNGDTNNSIKYIVPALSMIRFYTMAPMSGCSLSLSKITYLNPWQQPAANVISASKNPKCKEDTITLNLVNPPTEINTYLWSNSDTARSIKVSQAGNYQVIISNNNCSRTINPVSLSNYNTPPKPLLSVTDSFLHICSDTQIVITASGGNAPYYWSDGTTGNSISKNQSGNYFVYYKDINGCKSNPATPVKIIADTLPEFPTIEYVSKSSLCGANDSLEIRALVNYPDSLFWSNGKKGMLKVFGSTSDVQLYVQNRNGKCISQSFPIALTDEKPLKPQILKGGPLSFCEGGSVILQSDYFGTARWSDSSSLKSRTITKSGTYSVQSIYNGCASDASDTVKVNVFAKPATPIMTQVGDTLKVNSSETIIWYLNGSQLTTGTNNFYLPLISGTYTARSKNANDCFSTLSNAVYYNKTGIDENIRLNLISYPNPAQNTFTIICDQLISAIQISDSKGSVVESIISNNSLRTTIDIHNLETGFYTIGIKISDNWYFLKMIKTNL